MHNIDVLLSEFIFNCMYCYLMLSRVASLFLNLSCFYGLFPISYTVFIFQSGNSNINIIHSLQKVYWLAIL